MTDTRNTRGSLNASGRRRMLATIVAALGSDCAACGRETIANGGANDGRTLQLGHVESAANGGRFVIHNLLPICARCNAFMGDRDWSASGAPMRVTPLPTGTRMLPDPGTVRTHFDAPAWA